MDCRMARQVLPELVVGALSNEQTAEVQKHLSSCAGCRREHDVLLQTGALLNAMSPLRPSRDLWPAIRSQLKPRRQARPRQVLDWLRRPQWALAAAAIVGLLVGGIATLVQRIPPPPPAIVREADEDAVHFVRWNAQAQLAQPLADGSAWGVVLATVRESAVEPES